MAKPDGCLFCSIVTGETPGAIVGRGEGWTAFLDVAPVFFGHVLVVPDVHRETLLDLEPSEVPSLFGAAQRIARAVTTAMKSQGTFVAMNNKVSQSVPHLHVHVVPRTKGDGLRGFFWPRQKYPSPEAIDLVRDTIASALAMTLPNGEAR